METITVILLLAYILRIHAASFPFTKNHDLRIDCGVRAKVTEKFNHTWFPDSFFIHSGKIKQVTSQSKDDVPQVFNTLRHFPCGENKTHYYPLPLVNTQKYIFRAGFYYANYDNKSQPPVFDLQLGGQLWTTLDSFSGGLMLEEVVYWPRNDNITVCLVGRKDCEKPFISSLEATALDETAPATMYRMMNNGTTYCLVSRLNFGGYDQVVQPWSKWTNSCEENCNRYWTPRQMIGYNNLTFDESPTCIGELYENNPPDSVITTAVPNATRIMDIYVDGAPKGTVRFENHRAGEVVTLYLIAVGAVSNLTIAPGERTVLLPFLNGMEVFTATQIGPEVFSYGFKVLCSYIVVGILQFLLSGLLVLG